jgi:hypothetical protein
MEPGQGQYEGRYMSVVRLRVSRVPDKVSLFGALEKRGPG